jgi:hypothetical protein
MVVGESWTGASEKVKCTMLKRKGYSVASGENLGRTGCRAQRKPSVTSGASVQSDSFSPLPSHRRRRRLDTDMDSRNPFSKGLKRLNHKLAGGSRKRSGGPGSRDGGEGSEAYVEVSEASQRDSSLYPEVGDVGSGPSWEGDDVVGDGVGQAGPPTSTPSISYRREPNSM